MPILRYGIECFSAAKHDVGSLDFAVTRFLMKLFRSTNINVIEECRSFFSFMLPSEKIEKRRINFDNRRISFDNSFAIVCCTISTYVQNYANIVSMQYP